MQIAVRIGVSADNAAQIAKRRETRKVRSIFFPPPSKSEKGVSARKIALRVCYGIANDDLGRARPTSHKCFARYFIFRAPTLRTEPSRRGSGFRSREKNHSARREKLRDEIICATVVIIFQRRVKILRARRCAKCAFRSKSSLLLSPPHSFPASLPSLSFLFLFLLLSLLHLTLYRQRGTLVVAELTRRDFRTTKLRTPANVCKFAERISGPYCQSCNFY